MIIYMQTNHLRLCFTFSELLIIVYAKQSDFVILVRLDTSLTKADARFSNRGCSKDNVHALYAYPEPRSRARL